MKKSASLANMARIIDEGRKLRAAYTDTGFAKWWHSAKSAVANIFGDKSRNLHALEQVRFSPMAFTSSTPDSYFDQVRDAGIDRAIAMLESMTEEIQLYHDDDEAEEAQEAGLARQNTKRRREKAKDRTVFVVHGHDDTIKEQVARFLEHLDLKPIILHEQPNMGRTIIEKLEANATVGFAVVLLTADDTGSSKKAPTAIGTRARQNVVLELGLFVGLLGRQRVCALATPGLELPSDYSGVVYIPLESNGSWKFDLVRELKAAGLAIDANKAFS